MKPLEGAVQREALATAALLGEHGFRLRSLSSYEQRAHGVTMEFVDERMRTARVDVFVERRPKPRALMMHVEARLRGARPNRYVYDRQLDGYLIKGVNSSWSVEPTREDKTRFNLRACVARPILDAYTRMLKNKK